MALKIRPGELPSAATYTGLLTKYGGESDTTLREVHKLDEYTIELVRYGREMERKLLRSSTKDIESQRQELMEQLMRTPEEGGLGMNERQSYMLVRGMMKWLAEARKVDKAVYRMELMRRNKIAWEKAYEKGDLTAMNAADQNFIRVTQLDEPDEEKIDQAKIAIPNLLATVKWGDIHKGEGIEDLDAEIAKVQQRATAGVIDLVKGRDYWEMEDQSMKPRVNMQKAPDAFDREEDQAVESD